MLVYAVIVFAVAALGGLLLATSVLRGQLAPWALSLVHAALGAAGLVLVLIAVLGGAAQNATIALVILFVAALGGFFLASFHLRRTPGPKPVVLIHASAAVIGSCCSPEPRSTSCDAPMRVFGHPLHPMLVHFPIAFWSAGSLGDALTLAGVAPARHIAWLAIGAGDAVAIMTMVAGLLDYAAIEERAAPAARRHMAWMAAAWLLYTIAFVWRSEGLAPGDAPILLPALCGFAGFAALIGGAWRGGDLVYRHGAGVAR